MGNWECVTKAHSKLRNIYGKEKVMERHRHRYEVNNDYREMLEKAGVVISGTSPDEKLVEAIELKDHPFFIGTQYHPEYSSRPLKPHPLFVEFIRVVAKQGKKAFK